MYLWARWLINAMALKCRNVFARNQDVKMHKYGLLVFLNNLFILHLWSLNVNCIFFLCKCVVLWMNYSIPMWLLNKAQCDKCNRNYGFPSVFQQLSALPTSFCPSICWSRPDSELVYTFMSITWSTFLLYSVLFLFVLNNLTPKSLENKGNVFDNVIFACLFFFLYSSQYSNWEQERIIV